MKHLLFLSSVLGLLASGICGAAALTSNTITADGTYTVPTHPGKKYTFAAGGDFGSGSLALNWHDQTGNTGAITGSPSTAAETYTFTAPTNQVDLVLTGSTAASISITITLADATPNDIEDISGLQAALDAKLTKSTPTQSWVFEGDSWSAGTAQGNDQETFPYYLNILSGNTATITNVATAGQTAATMVGTFAAQVDPYLTATVGKPSIAFIFAGLNDAASRTTTQLRDDLRTMWAAARTQGAKVCAFTLPHRTAGGGWSQANWKIVNDQIIADSTYYDYLVRTDIIFSNVNSEYTDGLHVTTAAHKKFAGQVFGVLEGKSVWPSLPPDLCFTQSTSPTLVSTVVKRLGFSVGHDGNTDVSSQTIGSDTSVSVFTVPVGGTYEISGHILMGGLTAGDTNFLSAYITPLASGSETEYRGLWTVADAANAGCAMPPIRKRLIRGDKIYMGIYTSRGGATILTNSTFSSFAVKLVSIP